MKLFKKLSRTLLGGSNRSFRGKENCRAYAIGDVHGRLDLLNQLLEQIEIDVSSHPRKSNFLIFLGDLIDRGPDSAAVVERLRTYKNPMFRNIFLTGNHEEVLLRILAGEKNVLPSWLKFGGAECAKSYGLDPESLIRMGEERAIQLVQSSIPTAHREFLETFGDTFRFGDYLFVHAGIRPGIAIEEQVHADLRWIREPFLADTKGHGFIVVHGHTIVESVEERPNRIGIDTGAYRTGILTAIVIEDDQRRFLTSRATDIADAPMASADA